MTKVQWQLRVQFLNLTTRSRLQYRSFPIQGESHREMSLAMYPREFQNRQTSNFAKRGSALQKDETHDRRTA
ncbi:hypothetical protein Plhal304r1_c084g0168181 [Plasmopara halstedii]